MSNTINAVIVIVGEYRTCTSHNNTISVSIKVRYYTFIRVTYTFNDLMKNMFLNLHTDTQSCSRGSIKYFLWNGPLYRHSSEQWDQVCNEL